MAEFKTIGIVAKPQDERVGQTLQTLCAKLRRLRCALVFDESTREYLKGSQLPTVQAAELGRRCDLVVVIGGDGTLLQAARALAPAGVPLLGINQGRLGFMVDVRPEDMAETLAEVVRGHYVSERRLLLSATVSRGRKRLGPFLAVNDVVLRNLAAVRMLEFETWLGKQFISLHRADGLIVSSPTGSTAYALSGGGPVVHPSLQALTLVPICPHTLSDRPIVVSCDKPVQIVLGGSEGTRAICTCDGQVNQEVQPGDKVIVSRSRHVLRLIHPVNYDYFNILRNKLLWGRGPTQRSI